MPGSRIQKIVFHHHTGFSLWDMTDERVADVQRFFPDIDMVHAVNSEVLTGELVEADVLCSMRITSPLFQSARRLRWIHSPAAGIGGLMIPEVLNSDVLITNGRGLFSVVMAEHTLGFILACSRRFPDSYRFQAQHTWAQELLWEKVPHMGEVRGKTLGLVGLGSIGQEIAKRARAFEMRILAVKKDPSTGREFADEIFPVDQLHNLLRQSDFVVLAVPHTPETKHLIGEPELAVMKHSAYLLNVGRGKLIDEAALIKALNRGQIAGAALDVFETEPLPLDSPLWNHLNVFITPHSSACFPESWGRSRDLIVENIRRFQTGEPLLNLIDKKKGY
ncbi:MAG: D-2-hydroxyacid dehydrogenase [Acidobacteriia bacterium]|nr:D-2-hydroxyacid dehydrogenase [Terriglobia bacterium]